MRGGIPAWKKVESPMVAITGFLIPAHLNPWANPILAPIATSVQQLSKGLLIPKMVHPISPVIIISSFLYFKFLIALFRAK
jgi:hypothetical protein